MNSVRFHRFLMDRGQQSQSAVKTWRGEKHKRSRSPNNLCTEKCRFEIQLHRLLKSQGKEEKQQHLPAQKHFFPGGSEGKESACSAGDLSSIPGLGRSLEEGMATHSSILAWRIPVDRGAWWATVRGVTESRTRLSG